jgi:hypothetical protein
MMDDKPTSNADPPADGDLLDGLHRVEREGEVRITAARAMPHASDCAFRSGRTCSCDWLGNVVATIESVGRDCYEKSIFLAAASPSKPIPSSPQPSTPAIAD